MHAAEIIEALKTFEIAISEAKGDKELEKAARNNLQTDLNTFVDRNEGELEPNSSPSHQDMLERNTQLDESLDEITTELDK